MNNNLVAAIRGVGLAGLLAVLSGCASTGVHDEIRDPLEPINRITYKFNDILDRGVLYPLAAAYKDGVPPWVRTRILNFFTNLWTPMVTINDLLQGKGNQAASDAARFVLNTTFGVVGLFDVATSMGHEAHDEDFGQTLAVWGVPEGWYFVIPVLGPSTLPRDTLGWVGDYFLDPLWYADNNQVRYPLVALRAVDERSQLPSPDALVEAALDPYVFMREAYRQRRWNLIYDGNPPPEPEDLWEEDGAGAESERQAPETQTQ